MGRSQESFHKKAVKKKKDQKRKEKEKKKLARKETEKKGDLDNMIAYVDEHGNITSEPPDPTRKKDEVKAEDIEIGVPTKEESDEDDKQRTGKVTFFNDSKGYGFIKDAESGASIFVHVNNVMEEIREGITVQFEVEMGPKGPSAIYVKPV